MKAQRYQGTAVTQGWLVPHWFTRPQSNVSTSPTVWPGEDAGNSYINGLWMAKSYVYPMYHWGIFQLKWSLSTGGLRWFWWNSLEDSIVSVCVCKFSGTSDPIFTESTLSSEGGGWFPKPTTSQSKTQITNIASIKKHTKSIHLFVKSPCLLVKSPFLLVKFPFSFGGPSHGHPGFPTSPSTAGAAARAALRALGEATLVVGRPASLPAPAARRVEEAGTVNPR